MKADAHAGISARIPSPNEEALRSAALAVSSAAGEGVFRELVRALAAILAADSAFIALPKGGGSRLMKMLAHYSDGKIVEDFEYDITGTPCETVIGRQFQVYPSRVQELFPLDAGFRHIDAQSYAGFPLSDARGEPIGLMSVVLRREIDQPELVESVLQIFAARAETEIERLNAERAIRDREAQYRATFDASVDGMAVMSTEGRIVDANPAFLAMFGHDHAQLLAMPPQDLVTKESLATCNQVLSAAAEGRIFQGECKARRADGKLFDIELRGVTMHYLGQPHKLIIVREVTERKRAEAAMRASEEQYRAIFNASEDALLLWDSQLRRVDVNPAYERIYGWGREEVIGHSFEHRSLPPGYAERRLDLIRRALAGESCHVEFESIRKNGERFQAELRTIPFRHRGEQHVLAISRDITERRQREEALLASEEQYRAIFNASIDGMIIRKLDGEIVDVNPALLAMYGYMREEVIGKTFAPIIPDSSIPGFREYLSQVASGGAYRTEGRVPRKDGSSIHVEVLGSLVTYRGAPHVLSLVRDISERRAGEARLRATVDAALDCIIVMDSKGEIREFNAAAESCFGRRRADVLGRSLADTLIPERFREGHRRGMARYLETEEGPFLGQRVEVTAQRADGSEFPAELAIAVAQEPGGKFFVGYLRDITERRRAERERSVLEAQLRQAQKMEAIGNLAGGIAHDFNNILTGILGYLTLASERQAARDDPRLGRNLEQAQKASLRARDLIQQMLTFSRGGGAVRRPLQLAPLVEEAVLLLASSLPSTAEVISHVNGEIPSVLVDPVQVEQVLLNLCINAKDAMKGIGTIRLAVRAGPVRGVVCASCHKEIEGPFVEISVQDSGTGIEQEIMERMFEPFFSTKEAGHGSGMGLAMVHGIVHEHGGHIAVETSAAGTSFKVYLPPIADKVETKPPTARSDKDSSPPASRLSGHVLVVDDEHLVGEFMSELLQSWGLEVTVMRSAPEAEAWFERQVDKADAVITDQTMPRMTGVELARRLTTRRPNLPVLLYTGFADNIGDEQLARARVRALIRKPVEPEQLFSQLQSALGGRAGRGTQSRSKSSRSRKSRTRTMARRSTWSA